MISKQTTTNQKGNSSIFHGNEFLFGNCFDDNQISQWWHATMFWKHFWYFWLLFDSKCAPKCHWGCVTLYCFLIISPWTNWKIYYRCHSQIYWYDWKYLKIRWEICRSPPPPPPPIKGDKYYINQFWLHSMIWPQNVNIFLKNKLFIS